jgi:hypothetical protein
MAAFCVCKPHAAAHEDLNASCGKCVDFHEFPGLGAQSACGQLDFAPEQHQEPAWILEASQHLL